MADMRRWLVLLLVLVFAASAVLHAAGSAHAAIAAAASQDQPSIMQKADDELCAPAQPAAAQHEKGCAMVSVCAICVPVVTPVVLQLPLPDPDGSEVEVARLDGPPQTHFRPPRHFQNV